MVSSGQPYSLATLPRRKITSIHVEYKVNEPRSWFERFGQEKVPLPLHAVKPPFLSSSAPSLINITTELSLVRASDLSLETGVFTCLWYYSDIRGNSGKVLGIKQIPFTSISFPVNYAIIIPTFSRVNSKV